MSTYTVRADYGNVGYADTDLILVSALIKAVTRFFDGATVVTITRHFPAS